MMDGLEQPTSPHPASSEPAEDTGPFQAPSDWAPADRGEGPAELRARRLRALGYRRAPGYKGQTGPRSTRGKRRSSLNRVTRFLVPIWVVKDLRARGENPEEFRRLHRDLIGWLGPDGARDRVLVETLAEAWLEKIRRRRNWVGAGHWRADGKGATDWGTRGDRFMVIAMVQQRKAIGGINCQFPPPLCRLAAKPALQTNGLLEAVSVFGRFLGYQILPNFTKF